MVTLIRIIAIVTLYALSAPSYSEVSARLEREEIRINETTRLIIQSSSAGDSQPDISVLEQHFNIIGSSSGQNISIVNGNQSVVRHWTIELEPKSVGSFSLDPITVGSEQSNRLRIAILPEAKTASTGAEVFIEVEADADSVFVQQQLLLTVKLFLRARLLDGSLSDPEPSNAVVKRMGQDARYETRRADTTYTVFERRYAVFPQKSGDLEIPPFQFQGLAQAAGQNGQQMFNSLFNQGRRIRANSPALTITVKPPEPGFPGNPWLPAKKVQIEMVGQPMDKFEVGQPVTLKIQLQSLGLTAEQLPEIVIPETPGVRYYPDQGILETQDNGEDVIGIQLKSIAIIPNESGEISLPDIQIDWWNTETNSAETARLSGRQILVQDAPGPNTGQQPDVEKMAAPPPGGDVDLKPAASSTETAGFWKWLSIGSFGLWLLTLLFWLHTIFRRSSKPKADTAVVMTTEPD
ncbi:MAG: BatD family protein, partial [bacterium]